MPGWVGTGWNDVQGPLHLSGHHESSAVDESWRQDALKLDMQGRCGIALDVAGYSAEQKEESQPN